MPHVQLNIQMLNAGLHLTVQDVDNRVVFRVSHNLQKGMARGLQVTVF